MHAYHGIINNNNHLQRKERHNLQLLEHEKDCFQVEKKQPRIITDKRFLFKSINVYKFDNFGKALIIGLGLLILLR
jgi:hypothetical protein